MYACGIDLGTSNSAISVYRKGKTETLNIDGNYTIPSVVSFRNSATMLVGSQAKQMAEMYPQNTAIEVKREIGNSKFKYTIFGKNYSPVDISSFIITKLVKGAEKVLGGKIREVVVTVPAYFTEQQKEDTKKAGEAAGLKVLRLLPEPTAAAIAYGFGKGKDQTLLVYDLGGGTFDVSLLKVEGNNFEVIAVNGNHDLGGRDFDNIIVEFAFSEFKRQTGIDLPLLRKSEKSEDVFKAYQIVKEAAEKAKMELTESIQTSIDCPNLYKGSHLSVDFSREQFEKMIQPFIIETKDLVLKTLKDASMDIDDVDRIILVGGSTKIPLVKNIITETVKEPFIAENVDEIVSNGAALVAGSLSAPQEEITGLPDEKNIENIKVLDITAHSLGAEVLDEGGKLIFEPIIKKNSKIPCRGFFLGNTVVPGQTGVEIKVYRGEKLDCKKNVFLGDCKIKGIPPKDETIPVGIWFNLDENGILYIKAGTLEYTNPLRIMKCQQSGELNELKEGVDYNIQQIVEVKIELNT